MSEKNFFNQLAELTGNNYAGSNEILTDLNRVFINNLDTIDFTRGLFQKLHKSFSTFESIRNYLTKLENLTNQENKITILKFLNEFNKRMNNIYNRIFENLKPFLKKNLSIVTISNSATIFEILLLVHEFYQLKSIVISESRPQFEGRILSEKLLKQKINIELITEARIPEYVKNSDICLIGADKILSNGNVVNKIGSKLLALSCKYYGKPLYVVADSSKFSKKKTFSQPEKPNTEIWKNPPAGIIIHNLYFEEIEKELITKIITE